MPHPIETKFRALLLQGELIFVSIAMTLMVSALVAQVVARFMFEMAITWTDEIAIFSFIWVSLIGAAIVIETRNAHVIDYFVKKFPLTVQRIISAMVYILLLATCLIIVKYGADIANVVYNQRSSVLNLRMSWVYSAMPVSALLMGISLLFDWRFYLIPKSGLNTGAI